MALDTRSASAALRAAADLLDSVPDLPPVTVSVETDGTHLRVSGHCVVTRLLALNCLADEMNDADITVSTTYRFAVGDYQGQRIHVWTHLMPDEAVAVAALAKGWETF
jgi:hypothetical protein